MRPFGESGWNKRFGTGTDDPLPVLQHEYISG